jgi:undecaprenyl-diphosphatase
MTGVRIAEALSALGSVVGTCVVIALALVVLRRRNAAIVAIGVPLAAFLSDTLLKLLFHRPRPLAAAIPLPASYSFPSGHATVAAATYLTIGLLLADRLTTRRAKILCVALCALIALAIAGSRVYLGVHYLSDAAGGLVLGTALALVGRRYYVTRLRPQ